MEKSLWNSLYSYLKQTKKSFFFLNGKQEGKTSSVGKLAPVGGWEGYKGRVLRVSIVKILCTDVWKWKMRSIETVQGMGWGEIKRMMEGMNSNLMHCKNFGKFHNVPPYPIIW
jgi:hypothetical protein